MGAVLQRSNRIGAASTQDRNKNGHQPKQPRGGGAAGAGRRRSLAEVLYDDVKGVLAGAHVDDEEHSLYKCKKCFGKGSTRDRLDIESIAFGPAICKHCRGCGYDYPDGRKVLVSDTQLLGIHTIS